MDRRSLLKSSIILPWVFVSPAQVGKISRSSKITKLDTYYFLSQQSPEYFHQCRMVTKTSIGMLWAPPMRDVILTPTSITLIPNEIPITKNCTVKTSQLVLPDGTAPLDEKSLRHIGPVITGDVIDLKYCIKWE